MDFGHVDAIPITSREQWLGLRRQDITASDISAFFGKNFRSVFQIYAEKIGRAPPKLDNPLLWKGRIMEPAVFAALEDRYPMLELRPAKVYFRSPSHRAGATPDSFSLIRKPIDAEDLHIKFEPGILTIQAKVIGRRAFKKRWCVDNETPYRGLVAPPGDQIQAQMESY